MVQIVSNQIKSDQIGSNWIKKDQDGSGWLFGFLNRIEWLRIDKFVGAFAFS